VLLEGGKVRDRKAGTDGRGGSGSGSDSGRGTGGGGLCRTKTESAEIRPPIKPVLRVALWALATRMVMARRWMLAMLIFELLLVKGAYLLVSAAALSPWQCLLAILVASVVTAVPDVLLASLMLGPANESAGTNGGSSGKAATGSGQDRYGSSRGAGQSPFAASASGHSGSCCTAAFCTATATVGGAVRPNPSHPPMDLVTAASGASCACCGTRAVGSSTGCQAGYELQKMPSQMTLQPCHSSQLYDERLYGIRSPSSTMDFDSGPNCVLPE
ncbi:hypothetical protein VaNZ11_009765, partial [Volvox africanus]